jgi:(E)-4-hydroxy-3-methylbut-2-enyl-diphosphate synthase
MMIARRHTVAIRMGNVQIGNGAPISIQSMTKTKTTDVKATREQVEALRSAGCDIVRVAVPDNAAADALREIVASSRCPIVADIHFSASLALKALDAGVHGLRLNPGNIERREDIARIVEKAGEKQVPIRIGVNAGSLSRGYRSQVEQGQMPLAEAMVASAREFINHFESLGFRQIKISLKASDVLTTVQAYRLLARECDYPFHVGITEAGIGHSGIIKSAVGLGILLFEGLADTIRVSLTGDPCQEVVVAKKILRSLGLANDSPQVISCPTCGRTDIDVENIAREVEEALVGETIPLKIAIMGCVVNGPGEARDADVGITGGKGVGLVFRKGEIVRKVPESELVNALLEEVERLKRDHLQSSHTPRT